MAGFTAGFWACSEGDSSPADCVTEQCLSERYGDFNADSANLANSQVPSPNSNSTIADSANAGGTPADSSAANIPETSPDSAGTVFQDTTFSNTNDSIPGNSYTPKDSTADTSAVQSSSDVATDISSSSEETQQPEAKPRFVEDHRDECQIGNIPTSINFSKSEWIDWETPALN